MIHTEKVKALAFDFGGTLDSPFMHWMKIVIGQDFIVKASVIFHIPFSF